MKQVIFSSDARDKLREGINMVAEAVSATLGPKGRNAIISRDVAPPIITNDGVTIAASFNKVEDPWVNTGVQMIKEVSVKQNEPGDGTTTATVLAANLVNEGAKHILAGVDPIEIKEGIQRAASRTIEALKERAKQIKGKEELCQIATISVEDESLGRMIGEMMHQVGSDGAITVETSKDVKLEKDIAPGMTFDQGFMVDYFMTDFIRRRAELVDFPILVTDHLIQDNDDIVPIAEKLSKKGLKGLVIICDNARGEALNTMVDNTLKGIFRFMVIRLPGLDENRKYNGEDIAVATKAEFISKDLQELADVELDQLGFAGRVIVERDQTTIVNGGGSKEAIKERIAELKGEYKVAISDFHRDRIKERIARLSGGVGVLRIGAATEQELTYKKHKIEDALAATRAATEEGIIPGGGVALLRLSRSIRTEASADIGEKIFADAIKAPITQIARNAGRNAETICDTILTEADPNFGWDAKTDQFVDMLKAGIVDPVKVTRKAIENAVSMASMFLTAESLIVEVPEKAPTREEKLKASGPGR